MSALPTASAAGFVVIVAAAMVRRSRPRHRSRPTDRAARSPDALPLRHRLRRRSPVTAAEGAIAGEVQVLATSIAAGASVLGAFEALGERSGPWADGARGVVAQARAGRPVQDGIDRWATGRAARLVADAIAIASHSGGSLRLALASVELTLRERTELDREVRALASQARASALVLMTTPVAFAVLLAVADGRVRSFFLTVPTGPAVVLLGVALDVAGAAWMRRAVERIGSPKRTDRSADLPELIDLFLVAATAGHSVPTAIGAVAERAPSSSRPPLLAAQHRHRRGLPLVTSLQHFGAEVGPDANALVAALVRSHETGAPLGALLESAARSARDRRHRQAQEAARRLPVTLLFPLVACTLPAAVLLAVVPVLLVSLASLSL